MSESNAKTRALAERVSWRIGRLFAERDRGRGLIWPSDLHYRKSIIFPIRSAEPIFRRTHFRLAVFLPSRPVYDYQPAPTFDPPFRDARLSRAFDSRPFQTWPNLSSISPSFLCGFAAFYRAHHKQNIGRVLCCGDSRLKGNVFIREKGSPNETDGSDFKEAFKGGFEEGEI